MLHELLFALLGHPGGVIEEFSSVFTDEANAVSGTVNQADTLFLSKDVVRGRIGFRVAQDLKWVDGSEREALNRICQLGFYCKTIQQFVEDQRHAFGSSLQSGQKSATAIPTSYLEGGIAGGFASGLDEILNEYRTAIVRLEHVMRTQQPFPVTELHYHLDDYKSVLPKLYDIVCTVRHRKLHGHQILDLLHEQCNVTGFPAVQATLERLFAHCQRVLYDYISAWIVHGLLVDMHGEFFIKSTPSTHPTETSSNAPSAEPSAAEHHLWRGQFSIDAAAVPSYIPLAVSEKILFSGKAVRILRHQRTATAPLAAAAVRGKLPVSRHVDTNQDTLDDDVNSESDEPLPAEDVAAFATSLRDLQRQTKFRLLPLELAVDAIRASVASHLWRFVVAKGNLAGHLTAFKRYFLLGNGEFWHSFLEEARTLLGMPPTANGEHDINAIFRHAASRTRADEEDPFFEHFSLNLPPAAAVDVPGPRPPALEAWHTLRLKFQLAWPLNVFFAPEAFEKYNVMFHLLLTVKCVQMELNRVWAMEKAEKRTRNLRSSTTATAQTGQSARLGIWRLRHNMSFVINHLQSYIHMEVIEPLFARLYRLVEESGNTTAENAATANNARDFEALQRAHDQYLAALCAQCFIYAKPVSRALEQLFQMCLSFCDLFTKAKAREAARSEAEVAKLEGSITQLSKEFERQTTFLFDILGGVKGAASSPSLGQLLLRMDFNHYYSRASASRIPAITPGGSQPLRTPANVRASVTNKSALQML